MEYCSKFRPQSPVEYNLCRKSELPIPSLVGPTAEINTVQRTNADGSIDVVNPPDTDRNDDEVVVHDNSARNDSESSVDEQSQPNVTDDSDEIGDLNARNDGGNVPDEQPQQQENELEKSNDSSTQKDAEQNDIESGAAKNSEADIKDSLQLVQLDASDGMAISYLFDNNANVSAQLDEHAASSASPELVLGVDETAIERDGKIIVTKLFDQDLEMIYTYGQTPKALRPLYQIKINDIISANIPFKDNVREFT